MEPRLSKIKISKLISDLTSMIDLNGTGEVVIVWNHQFKRLELEPRIRKGYN